MKKLLVRQICFLSFILLLASCSSAQRVGLGVRVRPGIPAYVRPVPPSRNNIWIDGDWIWRNGGYVYKQGYWAAPRRGQRFVTGHWRNTKQGWQWTPGRWQRGKW